MPFVDISNRRYKILWITTRLNVGGPSYHVHMLGKFLEKTLFEGVLAHGRLFQGEREYLLPASDVRRVYLPSLVREVNPWNDIRVFFRLVYLILSEKPQVIHTHMAKAGILGRLAGWFCGVPILIHTYHGHIFDGYFSSWKTKIFISLERLLAKRSQCIAVMGEEIAKELVQKYQIVPRKKIRVFYPGLELSDYLSCERHRGKLREELGIPKESIVVAMIGRLSPVKRPQFFVKIARDILNKDARFIFLLIGGGEEEERVHHLIKELLLDKKILMLGWRNDLPMIYSDVDLVVQCSSDEGTPHVLIEALASGIPVVATCVGAVPEIVQDGKTGILVGKDDEEKFVKAILSLANGSQKRIEMGRCGREFVKERFVVQQFIRDSQTMYLDLLCPTEES